MSIEWGRCPEKNGLNCDILGRYISGAYRHSQILINRAFEKFNIAHGQYFFMLFVYFNEGVSQKDVSRELGVDKTTTAKALKHLEEIGYIERVQSVTDKRYYELYITEKGNDVFPLMWDEITKIAKIASKGLTEDEYKKTLECMKIICSNIREETDRILKEAENG